MGWRSKIISLAMSVPIMASITTAAELEERQTAAGTRPLFSGEFCDYTSFQASVIDNRLLMFGGNLTVNKGSSTKVKREVESGFQFFSIFLNETINTANNATSFMKREADPASEKRVASMRDGGAFAYNGDIYFYGGEQLFNAADNDTIFKCTPTSEKIVWNPATLNGVNRAVTKGAAVDASTENKGFYFGGQNIVPKGGAGSQSDSVLNDTYLNNLVVVSFSPDRQEYTNITAPITRAKPLAQSNLIFVPSGKEGLLVNLGGDDGTGGGAWETLQVFDIATSTWYNQQTRGNLTSGRSANPGTGTCSVVKTHGDTHYVYVYGGNNRAQGQSQLAILTIPTFQWFTVEDQNFPSKVDAQCQLTGERQMLIIGGRSSSGAGDCGGNSVLEILDISTLEIVSTFPDSSPFTAPTFVTTSTNSSAPADGWTDPALEGLYNIQYQTAAQRKGGGTDKAVIIGGVVGGVAGAIAIGLIGLWFIMKNHRKKSKQDVKEVVSEVKCESVAQPFLPPPQPSPGFPSPGYSQGYPSPGFPQVSPTFVQQSPYKDTMVEAPTTQAPVELPPSAPITKPTELPG
ncbi:hypothetical protein ABW19_dt0206739 [Dactylella cylindrospora]|nr:hypothetical protein ABW19_dt0206739 [Dactylella cylindrospora]